MEKMKRKCMKEILLDVASMLVICSILYIVRRIRACIKKQNEFKIPMRDYGDGLNCILKTGESENAEQHTQVLQSNFKIPMRDYGDDFNYILKTGESGNAEQNVKIQDKKWWSMHSSLILCIVCIIVCTIVFVLSYYSNCRYKARIHNESVTHYSDSLYQMRKDSIVSDKLNYLSCGLDSVNQTLKIINSNLKRSINTKLNKK